MAKKILITCPPMIRQIENYISRFEELKYEFYVPDFIQTLSKEELLSLVPKYDGWIIGDDPASKDVLLSGKTGNLKAIVKWGIGIDNINVQACKDLDISFKNTPGMFGPEVADLAICYLIGLARNAFYVDRSVRKNLWVKPTGISLQGKTLGIVGLGDIGKAIAKRASAHDLVVKGWDPFVNDSEVELLNPWPEGLGQCDFLIFSCALTKKTRHMFCMDTLDFIKNGLRIINISRGSLIKEDAIIKGLESEKINSVAFDVFEEEPLSKNSPLLSFDNCIFGSHNASNTKEAVDKTSLLTIKLISEMLSFYE